MNFVQALVDIPTLVKVIDSLIVTFEQPGKGAAKKEAVINTLATIYDVAAASGIAPTFTKEEVMVFADATINTVVSLKHNLGTFEKTVVKEVEGAAATLFNEAKDAVKNVVSEIEGNVKGLFGSDQSTTQPTTLAADTQLT